MNLYKESDRLWTRSFISLTISAFLLFLNLQMLLSSLSSYAKNELAASDLEVSLVTSIFAVSAILTRFLAAAMLRKFSPNVLLFAGLIIAAIMTELNDWVGSVGGLLLVRAGYGFGFGIGSTILPTLVSRIIPPSRMGEGIGYFGLSSSLAMSIGPMIGLNLLQKFGFGTLTLSGTMAVLVVIPLLLLTRALPRSNNLKLTEMKTTPGAGDSTPKRRAPFNRKLLFPAFLNTLLSITYSGLLSFIALFGEFLHLEQVGLFFLFNAVTVIIIRPISGRIFDAKGHVAVLIPAALLVVASMVVLSFTQSLPMLIVSALLYGLGFGATQPTLQAWMLRTSTPEQYGVANSMFFNTTDFGVAIGAIILGAIASATDYAVMYRYSAGVMGLFLVVYVASHFLVNKRFSTKNYPADRAAGSASEAKASSTN
ncbi:MULTISPECIES: MFS transporter [Paenibacillus]|uniref:MFS transporter n=1 Tax=Paenibacillus TaxID=44249 RepID=UPI0001AFD020|nr:MULTISPECIES: MFS transporter [unclassified Paenibacillus]EES75262.1 transporter, major facilitator family protein [Paenibacillus sp. oral taxon 786 str. D14]MCT2193977.1 MFS transporter [Paenibacillus sp. p3-SID1389]